MKLRNIILSGLASFALVAAPVAALANDAGPLEAGGPAAQGDAGLVGLGSIVEVGGVLFVLTVAGLVLLDDDDSGNATTTSL